MVSRAIEHDYGKDVSMQYIELADAESREEYQDILKLARKKYLRFPLVMMDDEIVLHGFLDYYSLSAIIKQRLMQLKAQT